MKDPSATISLLVTDRDLISNKIRLALGVLAFQLMSCEYHVENEDLTDISCDAVVSYSAVIRPLIDSSCMPCHNGDGTFPEAPNLTAFASVESKSALIKEVTQSRRMPKNGSITDAEIEAIRCWVDNGALNN